MAYFMLFNVSKEADYHVLKKELAQYGEINFFSLKDDTKGKPVKFGQLDYETISDVAGLKKHLHSSGIKLVEGKSKSGKKPPQRTSNSTQKRPSQDPQQRTVGSTVANPSFYFYKDQAYGKDIAAFKLENNYKTLFDISEAKQFELTTLYPGLLVGSGYNHPKLKSTTDDFQLGFFFDHTTGLPLISGSSIKGLLRSVFKHKEFMKEVYSVDLSEEIFEDNNTIFYDAYISESHHPHKHIFGEDYITSHFSDEKGGEFKDPNPIKFLKILPNVTFTFQFSCSDDQLELFKKIILDFGLGAKTNTGYGKFTA